MRSAAKIAEDYEKLSIAVREHGAAWYGAAHEQAASLAVKYGVTVETVAGIIAALSPRKQWKSSLACAERCLQRCKPGHFAHCERSAERIRDGEHPLAVLTAPKVRAFYRNLTCDQSAVTVDVWMARVLRVPDRMPGKRNGYERCVRRLKKAADLAGVPVSHLQAALWIDARGGRVT